MKQENNKIKKQSKKVKKENPISWEKLMGRVDNLCKIINNFDMSESKSDAVNYACYQIISWATDNHIEGVEILQEAMLAHRELSLAPIKNKCESIDGKVSQLK